MDDTVIVLPNGKLSDALINNYGARRYRLFRTKFAVGYGATPEQLEAFTLRLRYPRLTVVLGANSLSTPPRPRFHLRGTKGNYTKLGLDPAARGWRSTSCATSAPRRRSRNARRATSCCFR